MNVLPFFENDPHGTATKFPLYQAPVRTVQGPCTICKAQKPCLGVHSLIAPCPSCDKPRTWNVDDANGVTRCDWCERQADWPHDWPFEADEIRVCVDCLRAGHAAVSHATNLGHLHPPYAIKGMIWSSGEDAEALAMANGWAMTVIETFEDGSQSIGIHVPQALIDDLLRTAGPSDAAGGTLDLSLRRLDGLRRPVGDSRLRAPGPRPRV